MKNVADILGRLRSESPVEPTNKSHGVSSLETMMPDDLSLEIGRVEAAMLLAASELRFEEAAALRDILHTLQRQGVGVSSLDALDLELAVDG